MKKLVQTLLSLALALAVVLSLGVVAFADGAEDDAVETIDIGFNLSSATGVALDMRNVDCDDICLNGISYRPDVADGVMLIQLGDLAAAKLLTDYAAEAQKAGIDVAKLYIRGGCVYVNSDGLSADEAAALSAAVNAFMLSYKAAVSVGDIFTLANGAELKLRLRVVNFWYSSAEVEDEKEETKLDFFAFDGKKYYYGKSGTLRQKNILTINKGDSDYTEYVENVQSHFIDYKQANQPEITTVFFAYESADTTMRNNTFVQDYYGWVGIAKAEGDTNDYYAALIFSDADKDKVKTDDPKLLGDLAKTTSNKEFNEAIKGIFANFKDGQGGFALAKQIIISTDKDGKNVVFTINITNDTPDIDKVSPEDYKAIENPKAAEPGNKNVTNYGKLAYVPQEGKAAEVTDSDESSADVTVRDVFRCWAHDTAGANGACSKCGYTSEDTNLITTAMMPEQQEQEGENQPENPEILETPEQEGKKQPENPETPENPEQEGKKQPENPETPETPEQEGKKQPETPEESAA